MNKPNTQAAKTLGSIAFANGTKCAPALDGALMQMLAGRQVGDSRTTSEMQAWIAGWTEANIAAL